MADVPTRLHAAPSRPASSASSASSFGARTLTQSGASQLAASKLAAFNRRERLREFQAGLADKLRRAQGTPLAVNRLGIQIGDQRLLVDLADAGEILAVPDIVPVPLTKAWYRGLANVRGNLLGVIDLSLFAGGAPTPLDKESRVLAFAGDLQFAAGILVSRMLGLRSAQDLAAAGDDDAAADAGRVGGVDRVDMYRPWTRARLVDAQQQRWQEIDLGALTADPRFLDIART